MKKCRKCQEVKHIEHFYKKKRSKDGYDTLCNICWRAKEKIRYAAQREHRKHTNEKSRIKNKEKISARQKAYYTRNKDKIAAQKKVYIEKNREKRNLYMRNYYKNRITTDIEFQIKEILRARLRAALKGHSAYKTVLNLLGCTPEFFKEYIEKQFKPGMTWENHGYYTWHLDHIKPVSHFDLLDGNQKKECFHYTNLQPMWWTENLKKTQNTLLNFTII